MLKKFKVEMERYPRLVSGPTKMTRDYWIVFKNTESWWKILFKDRFSHVCVVYRDMDGFWRLMNPIRGGIDDSYVFMNDIEKNDCNYPDLIRKAGHPVVKITKKHSKACFPRISWYSLKPGYKYNCMTWCCYFMGIKPLGITPYQFYKHLMRLSRFENCLERYELGVDTISLTG